MEISKSNFLDAPVFQISEIDEHPEGGDRGGYCEQVHSFKLVGNAVEHEFGCSMDDPESFGIDSDCLDQLTTKEDALEYVRAKQQDLKLKLADLIELENLLVNNDYKELATESDYLLDDEDDEDDDDEE